MGMFLGAHTLPNTHSLWPICLFSMSRERIDMNSDEQTPPGRARRSSTASGRLAGVWGAHSTTHGGPGMESFVRALDIKNNENEHRKSETSILQCFLCVVVVDFSFSQCFTIEATYFFIEAAPLARHRPAPPPPPRPSPTPPASLPRRFCYLVRSLMAPTAWAASGFLFIT